MKKVNIIGVICIVLFVFMAVYMFALPDGAQDALFPVFKVINPYQTGAWIMGIGFLATCLWGKGRAGLIWGCVMLFLYIITAYVSLFGLMVMTSGWDLLWYLHVVLIIIALIIAIYRRRKKTE